MNLQDHPTENIFRTKQHLDPIARYGLEGDSIKEIEDDKVKTSKALVRNKSEEKGEGKWGEEEGVEEDLQSKESQISKILSEDSIKKIVIIILLIMMSIPLMQLSNYQDISTQWDYMVNVVHNML